MYVCERVALRGSSALSVLSVCPSVVPRFLRPLSSFSSSSFSSSSFSSSSPSPSLPLPLPLPTPSSGTTSSGLSYAGMLNDNVLNVPSLPIPELHDTRLRYISSVTSVCGGVGGSSSSNVLSSNVLSSNVLSSHLLLADDFFLNFAPQLHESIVDRQLSNDLNGIYPHSYIESQWDSMYLEGRWPICINSNVFYVLKGLQETIPARNPGSNKVLSSVLEGLLLWGNKVRSGGLEACEIRSRGCMRSFPLTIGTGRVARLSRDARPSRDVLLNHLPESRHIVVLCRNTPHVVTCVDKGTGKVRGRAYLERQLDRIEQGGESTPDNEFIGVPLTAVGRDECAKNREAVVALSERNKENVRLIDEALLVVCLDDPDEKMTLDDESRMLLHGGTDPGGRNRWFDKHELVRLGNGKIGMNFEHSFSDGMVWNRMLQEVTDFVAGVETPMYTPLEGYGYGDGDGDGDGDATTPLTFDLNSPSISSSFSSAYASLSSATSNLSTSVLLFPHFGKNKIKTWGVSPDAAVQMAYQNAYRVVHGDHAPTYESCATRNFYRGRTETIRSLTNESRNFVEANVAGDDDDDREVRRRLFRSACDRHVETARAAKSGNGIDRHLLALEDEAKRRGLRHPIFDDELFNRSKTWLLSSSNVSAPFLDRFGFGAVTGNGYGLGYMIHDDYIPINVTNFKDSEDKTDSKLMKENIEESLLGFSELMDSAEPQ